MSTLTVSPQVELTREELQVFEMLMLSLNETAGHCAVLVVACALPPPTPPIVAVITSEPPFELVVMVAE
jgi:hypothetical protein